MMEPFAIDRNDFDAVVEVIRGRLPLSAGMAELVSLCAARLPHPVWDQVRNLDFEPDAHELQAWLEHVLLVAPPPHEIDGLYFGLGEYRDDERDTGTICRLDLVGGSGFDSRDEECLWAVDPTYIPDVVPADSGVLKTIYRQVQMAGERHATLGEYVLGLGYGFLAVREMAEALRPQVLKDRSWRGLAVGFNCGDVVLLGRLGVDGQVRRD
jgi:hypothetical protein